MVFIGQIEEYIKKKRFLRLLKYVVNHDLDYIFSPFKRLIYKKDLKK